MLNMEHAGVRSTTDYKYQPHDPNLLPGLAAGWYGITNRPTTMPYEIPVIMARVCELAQFLATVFDSMVVMYGLPAQAILGCEIGNVSTHVHNIWSYKIIPSMNKFIQTLSGTHLYWEGLWSGNRDGSPLFNIVGNSRDSLCFSRVPAVYYKWYLDDESYICTSSLDSLSGMSYGNKFMTINGVQTNWHKLYYSSESWYKDKKFRSMLIRLLSIGLVDRPTTEYAIIDDVNAEARIIPSIIASPLNGLCLEAKWNQYHEFSYPHSDVCEMQYITYPLATFVYTDNQSMYFSFRGLENIVKSEIYTGGKIVTQIDGYLDPGDLDSQSTTVQVSSLPDWISQ
jgi:hypothetical protein